MPHLPEEQLPDSPLEQVEQTKQFKSLEVELLSSHRIEAVALETISTAHTTEIGGKTFHPRFDTAVTEIGEEDRQVLNTELSQIFEQYPDHPLLRKHQEQPHQVTLTEFLWLINQLCWRKMSNGNSSLQKGLSVRFYLEGEKKVVACNTFNTTFLRIYQELIHFYPQLKKFALLTYSPDKSLNTWNTGRGSFPHLALMLACTTEEEKILLSPIDPYWAESTPSESTEEVTRSLDMSAYRGQNAIGDFIYQVPETQRQKVEVVKILQQHSVDGLSSYQQLLYLITKVDKVVFFLQDLQDSIASAVSFEEEFARIHQAKVGRSLLGIEYARTQFEMDMAYLQRHYLTNQERQFVTQSLAELDQNFHDQLTRILDLQPQSVSEQLLLSATLFIGLQTRDFWKQIIKFPELLARVKAQIHHVADADVSTLSAPELPLVKSTFRFRQLDTPHLDFSSTLSKEQIQSSDQVLFEIKAMLAEVFKRLP